MKLYLICNAEGKYFRKKGYGGYGDSWTDDITKARIYGKIGGARTVVGWWYNNHPDYGAPDIIEMDVIKTKTINETMRYVEQEKEKEEKKLNREKRDYKKKQKEEYKEYLKLKEKFQKGQQK